ncbi:hypothetical protein GWI33_002572, partial [Rhynchophorus ferrugineus]
MELSLGLDYLNCAALDTLDLL